jgi:spore coat protein U-like protein
MKRMLVAIALAALPAMISAATVTSTLSVTANVLAGGTCTVESPAVVFGTVTPPISANVDSGNWIGVTCPGTVPYSISLSPGGSGNYSQRKMSLSGGGPTDTMNYNIYTTDAYTTIWGDGTGGTGVVTGTGSGTEQISTTYGRIPPQVTPAAGAYTDSITVTVTY